LTVVAAAFNVRCMEEEKVNDNSQTKLMKPYEVAELLGVSTHTLSDWRNEGRGPVYHKIGHGVRYHIDEVNQWIFAQRREPLGN